MSDSLPDPELPTGTHLGRYRIERLIGSGGMGSVYLASHTGLNKRVVVKVLHSHYARSAEVRMRFVREGEAAARIRHAHVVDVTDVGVQGATPYLVMEYLEGESLGDLLAHKGAFSPDRAVDLMLPIIDAVHAAHTAGVVHRDLKPDNLFVVRTATGDLHPKVLDFGISRVVEERERLDRTNTAAMLGTPSYMSPEQVESARDVDAASDQYSLGVILYECLTGVRAFDGDGVFAVLIRVKEAQFERPRALRPEIDPRLEAVVLRAMAARRSARFPSLRAFGTALLPFASPRARMIWGTTFDPPTDHGSSDTRLEFASAPPRVGEADTVFHSTQEREHTTIPLGARRRRRTWLLAVAGALGVAAVSAVGLSVGRRVAAPVAAASIAPVTPVVLPPARPEVVAAPPVTSLVAAPVAVERDAGATSAPGAAPVEAPRPAAPSRGSHRRRPRINLPP